MRAARRNRGIGRAGKFAFPPKLPKLLMFGVPGLDLTRQVGVSRSPSAGVVRPVSSVPVPQVPRGQMRASMRGPAVTDDPWRRLLKHGPVRDDPGSNFLDYCQQRPAPVKFM